MGQLDGSPILLVRISTFYSLDVALSVGCLVTGRCPGLNKPLEGTATLPHWDANASKTLSTDRLQASIWDVNECIVDSPPGYLEGFLS